jgi:hypothetical protein
LGQIYFFIGDIKVDADELHLKINKHLVKIDKLNQQVNSLRAENTDLKSKILDIDLLQVRF